MMDIMKKRRLIYLVIGMHLVSVIQFAPVDYMSGEQPFFSESVTTEVAEEESLIQEEVEAQESLQTYKKQLSLVAPKDEGVSDYKMPDDTKGDSLVNGAGNGVSKRYTNKQSYQLIRLLVLALSMMLYPTWAQRNAYRGFCGPTEALWYNITYIHRLDGKKGRRFFVAVD